MQGAGGINFHTTVSIMHAQRPHARIWTTTYAYASIFSKKRQERRLGGVETWRNRPMELSYLQAFKPSNLQASGRVTDHSGT